MMNQMFRANKRLATLLLILWAIILMGSLVITVMNMSCFLQNHQCTQEFLRSGEQVDHHLSFVINYCCFFFLASSLFFFRPNGVLQSVPSESPGISWTLSDRDLKPPRLSF